MYYLFDECQVPLVKLKIVLIIYQGRYHYYCHPHSDVYFLNLRAKQAKYCSVGYQHQEAVAHRVPAEANNNMY